MEDPDAVLGRRGRALHLAAQVGHRARRAVFAGRQQHLVRRRHASTSPKTASTATSPQRGNKLAIIFEPNDPKTRHLRLTYRELHQQVCQFANVLHNNGVEKGDRVVHLHAHDSAAGHGRAGLRPHWGGALGGVCRLLGHRHCRPCKRRRKPTIVLTADGLNRGAKQIPVKSVVDEALENCPSVRRVIVVEHLGWPVHMEEGRDVWYHEEAKDVAKPARPRKWRPKTRSLSSTPAAAPASPRAWCTRQAGYMVWADYTFRNVFQVEENDMYWCTADIGWVTGHTLPALRPAAGRRTTLHVRGRAHVSRSPGRFWEVIDKHDVTIFYTAPTAIRSPHGRAPRPRAGYSLSSLRVLGSVGEPINEEAWHWYHQHVGKGRCPIVDTWWQTETGGIMISALAGITPSVPARAGLPLPGVQPVLLNSGRHRNRRQRPGRLPGHQSQLAGHHPHHLGRP